MNHPVAVASTKRTNDRIYGIPAWLRSAFTTAGSIAPGLAAIPAERMFFTPPRPRPSERMSDALSRGTPFEVKGPQGTLVCWSWGEGPAVLLAHGWGGLGGQLASIGAAFAASGFRAVTFDGPAHGISEGRRTNLLLFGQSMQAIADRVGPLAGIVAHSFGAASAAIAMDRGLRAKRVVFIGPPFDPERVVSVFAGRIGLPPTAVASLKRRIERRVGLTMDEVYVPRLARNRDEPLRVYHDRGDTEVPWEAGAAIASAWPDAELVTTEGLGHYKILHDPAVVAGTLAFIRGGRALAHAVETAARIRDAA